jgi:hypothetical protein
MDGRMKFGIGALVVVAALTVAGQLADGGDSDPPERHLTPTEAACEMIADGDTAEEAYNILLGLDVRPTTASRAVNRAIAGDC